MEKLKTKDCAKILYNLYKDCFNRKRATFIPLEVAPETEAKYRECCERISPEEIWAYSHMLIDLSSYDEPLSHMKVIDIKRESAFEKRRFLNAVVLPLIKIFNQEEESHTVDAVNDFIIQHNLCDEIEGGVKWLVSSDPTMISVEEAAVIVGNVRKTFKEI